MDLRKTGCKGVVRSNGGLCEHGDETVGSI